MEFLIELEEMWGRMLMDVLSDNQIPHRAEPVYGAAFALKTGQQDLLRIYVPADCLAAARAITEELFSPVPEEE